MEVVVNLEQSWDANDKVFGLGGVYSQAMAILATSAISFDVAASAVSTAAGAVFATVPAADCVAVTAAASAAVSVAVSVDVAVSATDSVLCCLC